MKKVTKAIIPVAGLGTRMLPATKAIPKEMLPLADKPLIQYIVNECIEAGLKEIVLVTHSSKNSIENHFDTSFELESILEKRVKRTLLKEVRSILPEEANIMHIRQGVAKGLGHAVLSAYPLVNDEPVAVILPDVVLNEFSANQKVDNLAAMLARYHTTGRSQILVEPVASEYVDQYGIVGCANNHLQPGQLSSIECLIEKPKLSEAPSQLAIVGRYVLSQGIWPLLRRTPIGTGDEVQLTDALRMLMAVEQLEAYCLVGKSHDCGSKLGYFQAFVEYAMQHQQYGDALQQWIKQQNLSNTQ